MRSNPPKIRPSSIVYLFNSCPDLLKLSFESDRARMLRVTCAQLEDRNPGPTGSRASGSRWTLDRLLNTTLCFLVIQSLLLATLLATRADQISRTLPSLPRVGLPNSVDPDKISEPIVWGRARHAPLRVAVRTDLSDVYAFSQRSRTMTRIYFFHCRPPSWGPNSYRWSRQISTRACTSQDCMTQLVKSGCR